MLFVPTISLILVLGIMSLLVQVYHSGWKPSKCTCKSEDATVFTHFPSHIIEERHEALPGSQDGVAGRQAALVVVHRIQSTLLQTHTQKSITTTVMIIMMMTKLDADDDTTTTSYNYDEEEEDDNNITTTQ